MIAELEYTIHHCITAGGADRRVNVAGEKAKGYIKIIERELKGPINSVNLPYKLKTFGITIESIKEG